ELVFHSPVHERNSKLSPKTLRDGLSRETAKIHQRRDEPRIPRRRQNLSWTLQGHRISDVRTDDADRSGQNPWTHAQGRTKSGAKCTRYFGGAAKVAEALTTRWAQPEEPALARDRSQQSGSSFRIF